MTHEHDRNSIAIMSDFFGVGYVFRLYVRVGSLCSRGSWLSVKFFSGLFTEKRVATQTSDWMSYFLNAFLHFADNFRAWARTLEWKVGERNSGKAGLCFHFLFRSVGSCRFDIIVSWTDETSSFSRIVQWLVSYQCNLSFSKATFYPLEKEYHHLSWLTSVTDHDGTSPARLDFPAFILQPIWKPEVSKFERPLPPKNRCCNFFELFERAECFELLFFWKTCCHRKASLVCSWSSLGDFLVK